MLCSIYFIKGMSELGLYKGWETKMNASRQSIVVLALSEYKCIKKQYFAQIIHVDIPCPQIEVR